jgi:hypothetical protein
VSLFSTAELMSQGTEATPTTNYTPETSVFKQNDYAVNQVEFSAFDKQLLAAA